MRDKMNREDAKDTETKENIGLPRGWVWAELQEIVSVKKGKKPAVFYDDPSRNRLPYIDIEAFEKGIYRRYADPNSGVQSTREDILVVWDGARAGLVGGGIEGILGSTIAALTPLEVDKSYLRLYLQSRYDDINSNTRGIGIPHINPSFFLALAVPLAPLPEQRRIVAEIEKRFTRLDAGIAALKRVQANLKRYKAAVLKAACEGKLVPQDPNDEPASVLLERIAQNRKDARKQKDVAALDVNALPALPRGWCWATLSQCFKVERGRFSHRPRNEPRFYNGIYPFVQIGDLPRDGGNIVAYSQTLNEQGLKISKMFPKGSVLIAIVGATIANTGILTFDSCCPDSLVAVQSDDEIQTRFAEMYLRSKKLEIRQTSYASGGQPNINLASLLPYPIPVPPLAEQHRIVAEVERRLSVAQELEVTVAANLARAERLRQAILAQAFAGKLVPQDPNDEPASVLLERIRANRKK